jgi:hypothetical protein
MAERLQLREASIRQNLIGAILFALSTVAPVHQGSAVKLCLINLPEGLPAL